MRIFSFAAACVFALTSNSVASPDYYTMTKDDLISMYFDANHICRGGPASQSEAHCEKREEISDVLYKRGYCGTQEAGIWKACMPPMPDEIMQLPIKRLWLEKAHRQPSGAIAGMTLRYTDFKEESYVTILECKKGKPRASFSMTLPIEYDEQKQAFFSPEVIVAVRDDNKKWPHAYEAKAMKEGSETSFTIEESGAYLTLAEHLLTSIYLLEDLYLTFPGAKNQSIVSLSPVEGFFDKNDIGFMVSDCLGTM